MSAKQKIMVIGAGSAGCHLTRAGESLGYDVDVADNDPDALTRFMDLYHSRYGAEFQGGFLIGLDKPIEADYYVVATPPASHYAVTKWIADNIKTPKVLVEKPLCLPYETELFDELDADIKVNYNHLASPAMDYMTPSNIITANWLESIDYILDAHPWLDFQESYLSDYKKGGGSAFEHSHGLAAALWLLPEIPTLDDIDILDVGLVMDGAYDKSMAIRLLDKRCNIEINSMTDFMSKTVEKSLISDDCSAVFFNDKDRDRYESTYYGGFVDIPKTRNLEFQRGLEAAISSWRDITEDESYEIGKLVVQIIGEAFNEAG
jgi:hypothetical protein